MTMAAMTIHRSSRPRKIRSYSPPGARLGPAALLLAGATAASVIKARQDPTARAHAGRLRERRSDADAPKSDQRQR